MAKLKFKKFIVWFLLGLYILGSANLSAFAMCANNIKNVTDTSYSKSNNVKCCCCKKESTGIKQVFDNNKDGCDCMQSRLPANKSENEIAAFSKNIESEKIVNLYNLITDYLNLPKKNINQNILKYSFNPNINTDLRSTIVLLI